MDRSAASRRLRQLRQLYLGKRKPAPIIEAACWAHARRRFFELADIEAAARRRVGKNVEVIAPWRWKRCGAWTNCSPSSAR